MNMPQIEEDIPPPPDPALFMHNHPFTAADRQKSHEAISQIRTAIARIEAKELRLSYNKRELRMALERHQAVTNSICQIPNEILGKIMEQCLQINGESPFTGEGQPVKTVLGLAAVSSHWRAVALSTPQLWTTITWRGLLEDVDMTTSFPDQLEQRYALLGIIKGHYNRLDYLCDGSGWILKDGMNMEPSFQRLRKLDLLYCHPLATNTIIQIFARCSKLESVRIGLDDGAGDSTISQSIVMRNLGELQLSYQSNPSRFFDLITTPKLRKFMTYEVDRDISFPGRLLKNLFERSEARLQELNLDVGEFSVTDVHAILDAVPHLRKLHINASSDILDPAFDYLIHLGGNPILPDLKSLSMCSVADWMLAPICLTTVIESRAEVCPLEIISLWFHDGISESMKQLVLELEEDADYFGYILEIRDGQGNITPGINIGFQAEDP